jgi:two-component system response regulator YesN
MQQGDRVYSQLTLRELFDYVQLNAPSLLVQKYFCYDIINTYMKHVQKSNFEINSEVSEAILHGDSPQNLYQSMQKSVDEYCAWIALQQEKQQQDSAKQIADYVDERYTDPALSLDMIADHFSISIYMVSRILKEYWNCGYKEYLTEKRIRFGKQLLEKDSLNISDIAAATGFNDAMHFSRTFRANTGISPIQYRKIMASNIKRPQGLS